ncbi:c6 finger domain [Diplodia corticola]|uniref:C6 finger domain n=1 Tax=Diplodia corticola TaxID=236234 RepID=A0A1J9R4J7_9PEZI|nr:c6 finger domain [Diplodia corticola]OJD35154.1 c6 finger domain [Diplodia corticola]
MSNIVQSVEGSGGDVVAAAATATEKAGGWQRGPRPEMAYQCGNLDDLLAAMQYEVQTHSQSLIPEEASCRLLFTLNAGLEFPKVRNASSASSSSSLAAATPPLSLNKATNAPIDPDPCPGYSIAAALSNFCDSKEKLKYQRVIAKAIITTVGAADGFRYAERRATDTAKSDGYRFWYVCRDSLQNKDRVANKRASGQEPGPDAKDTFDCKGGARVTFSIKNLCIDVWYHHLPIHDSAFELDKANGAQKEQVQQQETASVSQPPVQYQPMPSYAFWETPSGTVSSSTPQTDAIKAGSSKRKRARPKKPSGNLNTESSGPSSSQDTRGLDTLVNAITVDLNGGINGTIPNVAASSSKPRTKKAKTQAAPQPASAVATSSLHTAHAPLPPATECIDGTNPGPTASSSRPKGKKNKKKTTEQPTLPVPATSPPPASVSASASVPDKKKRDRGGTNRCSTCSSRKIKCDGKRPICSGCAKSNKDCRWLVSQQIQSSKTSRNAKVREGVMKKMSKWNGSNLG